MPTAGGGAGSDGCERLNVLIHFEGLHDSVSIGV